MCNVVVRRSQLALLLTLSLGTFASTAHAQGVTGYKDASKNPVKGAAGTSGGTADSGVERCDKPMGAIAVVEPQGYVSQALSQYGLSSPTRLIRLIVQQSNCFIVVERGMGMQNVMQERELAASGELRQGSNMGGGQMVAADYVMTPGVEFSENNAGGIGGAIGGLIGNRTVAGVLGGLKFKEAQTTLLLADARSGVQVAAAEGSVSKADFSLGGIVGGLGGAAGGLGGYTNTNEGKIVAAGFVSNYNKLVQVVRNDPSLQRDVGTLKEEAGKKTIAGAVFNEGDVLTAKIAGVKVLATPADGAKTIGTLARGEEVVFLGKDENGWLQVQGAAGEGWVKKALVGRQ